jgi:hypothetical protein
VLVRCYPMIRQIVPLAVLHHLLHQQRRAWPLDQHQKQA